MDELKITSETRLRILDEVLGTDADVDKFMIEQNRRANRHIDTLIDRFMRMPDDELSIYDGEARPGGMDFDIATDDVDDVVTWLRTEHGDEWAEKFTDEWNETMLSFSGDNFSRYQEAVNISITYKPCNASPQTPQNILLKMFKVIEATYAHYKRQPYTNTRQMLRSWRSPRALTYAVHRITVDLSNFEGVDWRILTRIACSHSTVRATPGDHELFLLSTDLPGFTVTLAEMNRRGDEEPRRIMYGDYLPSAASIARAAAASSDF